jgi:hypothetical protein
MLFGAVATKPPARPLAILVATLGVLLCVLWFGLQRRMAAWIEWWERRLELLEPLYFARFADSNEKHWPTSDFHLFEHRRADITKGCVAPRHPERGLLAENGAIITSCRPTALTS